ncbi:hypothetical protein AX15_004492 [Amanita polypyramis BW_CC]|nr:hypothetical protein AX15_004492 [Amanita polypyramis BW_CC]
MADHHVYLAVLKASYDYQPQSDDELAITENQTLLLLERVDDDWWKVKVKSDSQDEETPSGLVPAAYVEPAGHLSVVKVLYDYEASAPGELSVKEDEVLLVYETDQDWLLVQSRKEDSKAGYVPGNYVEATTEEEITSTPAVDVPSSRPPSVYVDPADRVASSKASQPSGDPIKTWSVTDIDKKGKKKKGTLGIGNGAIFFASESDKTPVQKWQTSDVQDVVLEKSKLIRIDVGGTNPTSLHYNAGSKENAEAIQDKILLSKSLSSTRVSHDLAIDSEPPAYPPPAATSARKVGKKASVHFSQSDPVIIPPREDEEDGEDEEDDLHGNDGEKEQKREYAVVLYDFTADGEDELTVKGGEELVVLEKDGDEWWKCRNMRGEEGVVPASYIEETMQPANPPSPPTQTNTEAEAEKERAEVAAKAAREAEERAGRERREREEQIRTRKKQEAQQRAKEAAVAAEAEQRKRKAAIRISSPPAQAPEPRKSADNGSASRPSAELNRPPPDQVRTWHDRTGQFRVDAAFLGLSNNKVRLHKVNGVVVEVPTEKMSVDNMRYIEKLMNKKSSKPASSSQRTSDDDAPLAIIKAQSSSTPQRTSTPKKSNIDWFEFFLSAGCDIDDCSRYATSFEKDKIDETLLPDITESTMRTLGLREGDIIRVSKAIEKRKVDGHSNSSSKSSSQVQEQVRRDGELARQLQSQETGGGSPMSPAPNLFAGPGGVLKAPRRRPQPSKTLPPSVDINVLSSVSDQATSSPQVVSPTAAAPSSTPVQPPARTTSATPAISRFDDDAWTNRPSSAKPVTSTPPAATPRAPSAPPTSNPTVPTPATAALPPQPITMNAPAANSGSSLAKTTEADIFDQLVRLGELRKSATPTATVPSTSPTVTVPVSYQAGLGMSPSPLPKGQHLQNPQLQSQQPSLVPSPSPQPQFQPQSHNGPRGPYAPVPANQSLLQPLIPTQTGFGGFIPTRPINNASTTATVSSLTSNAQPSFLTHQPTGLPNQMLLPQVTGVPFGAVQTGGNFGPGPLPMQPQFTGFNPGAGQFIPNNFTAPPVPPLPSSVANSNGNNNSTSPANVFAQMKSGTFANEDNPQPQSAEKYDALRPSPFIAQPTGWTQPYQSQFMGYPR